jgi:ribosomal protein S18 acetylase RimI-like enzyme
VPIIRSLSADDAEAWLGLRLEMVAAEPRAFAASVEDELLSVDDVRARLGATDPACFVIGAVVDGALVGAAGLYRGHRIKMRHLGTIWGMYVSSAHRGAGLGGALLDAVISRATAVPELTELRLSVATTQPAAEALYRTRGFVQWAEDPTAFRVADEFVRERLFRLPLGAAPDLRAPAPS